MSSVSEVIAIAENLRNSCASVLRFPNANAASHAVALAYRYIEMTAHLSMCSYWRQCHPLPNGCVFRHNCWRQLVFVRQFASSAPRDHNIQSPWSL